MMSEPRFYTAHNLVIDREQGVVCEFRHQSAKATAINAAKHASRLNDLRVQMFAQIHAIDLLTLDEMDARQRGDLDEVERIRTERVAVNVGAAALTAAYEREKRQEFTR